MDPFSASLLALASYMFSKAEGEASAFVSNKIKELNVSRETFSEQVYSAFLKALEAMQVETDSNKVNPRQKQQAEKLHNILEKGTLLHKTHFLTILQQGCHYDWAVLVQGMGKYDGVTSRTIIHQLIKDFEPLQSTGIEEDSLRLLLQKAFHSYFYDSFLLSLRLDQQQLILLKKAAVTEKPL